MESRSFRASLLPAAAFALMLSASASADPCPNLSGSYRCEPTGRILAFTMKKTANVTTYFFTEKNRASDKKGSYSDTITVGKVFNTGFLSGAKASCSRNRLVIDVKHRLISFISTSGKKFADQETFSLDPAGNLILEYRTLEDGTVVGESIQTCMRVDS